MSTNLWCSVALFFILEMISVGQAPIPTRPPGPVVSRTAPTRPDSVHDTNLYDYWSKMTNQDRTGGALLGKVTISGEMLPWEPIVVSVKCNGAVVHTTVTDSRGFFAVTPSSIPGEISQQGDLLRQMKTHYEGCLLEGTLTGFRSSAITITARNLREEPEVGSIILSRDTDARGTAMSTTSLSAPGAAANAWAKAGEEMLAQRPERARKALEKAVHAYPGFADAWYELGRLQLVSDPNTAKLCFQNAVAADPNFVRPYGHLAELAAGNEDWQQVLQRTDRSLHLEPEGTIWIWYYRALANFRLGKVDEAEISAKKLIARDPLHNVRNGEQLLAAILARKSDFAGALAHLRNCLTYIQDTSDVALLKEEITQLEHRVATPN
jgi:hypothetical protein